MAIRSTHFAVHQLGRSDLMLEMVPPQSRHYIKGAPFQRKFILIWEISIFIHVLGQHVLLRVRVTSHHHWALSSKGKTRDQVATELHAINMRPCQNDYLRNKLHKKGASTGCMTRHIVDRHLDLTSHISVVKPIIDQKDSWQQNALK